MSMQHQVVVIGGGPAGAVAACILARQNVSVLICEGRTSFGQKVGECLPPQATRLLASLGFAGALEGQLKSPGIRASWGNDEFEERHFLFESNGEGHLLNRAQFDQSLAKASVDAGATWLGGVRLLNARCRKNIWRLELIDKHGVHLQISSPIVIDATGRAARLGRCIGAKRQAADRLVAVVATFEDLGSRPADAWPMVKATCDGWWYHSRLPMGQSLVAKFCDADLLQNLRNRASRSSLTEILLADGTGGEDVSHSCRGLRMIGSPVVRSASSSLVDALKHPLQNWLSVGDAALTFDPIASHGITSAISSGYYGACAAFDSLQGNSDAVAVYRSTIEATYADAVRRIATHYQTEARWPEATFWCRRNDPRQRLKKQCFYDENEP